MTQTELDLLWWMRFMNIAYPLTLVVILFAWLSYGRKR